MIPPPLSSKKKKKKVRVLIPETYECDLIWKKNFKDVIKLRISKRDYPGFSKWTLYPMTIFLIRDRKGEGIDIDTEEKGMQR